MAVPIFDNIHFFKKKALYKNKGKFYIPKLKYMTILFIK